MIRLIVQSSENGEQEYVQFLENRGGPIEDLMVDGCTLDSDDQIPDILPPGFPRGYLFKRCTAYETKELKRRIAS